MVVAPERFFVRLTLSVIVVAISVASMPFMLILKLVEGVYVTINLGRESLRQAWAAKGIPEFDKAAGVPKRRQDDV
jgi:hypothetical protein